MITYQNPIPTIKQVHLRLTFTVSYDAQNTRGLYSYVEWMSDYAKILWQKLVLAAELCDLLARNKKAKEGALSASWNGAARK